MVNLFSGDLKLNRMFLMVKLISVPFMYNSGVEYVSSLFKPLLYATKFLLPLPSVPREKSKKLKFFLLTNVALAPSPKIDLFDLSDSVMYFV